MQRNIGIIAGSGLLPSLLVNEIRRSCSAQVFIVAINDNADVALIHDTDYEIVHLGQVKKAIDFLRKNSVTEIVFAGGIKKPSLLSMKLDKKGLLFLSKIGLNILSGGDDNLLRIVINLFENEGFKIVAMQDLALSLLVNYGVMSKCSPSKVDLQDIEVGNRVLLKMGDLDIGQSVIVENRAVLGIEAAEGTDSLIQRCAILKKEKNGIGVLIKRKKTHQDIRIDLPAIGVNTIEFLHKSGFKGIAVGANESLIINKQAVINLVDKYKLFLVGI
jgi:DUF1009 family protein